jgi:hypothetical protein
MSFKDRRTSHNFRNFLHKFVPDNNEKIKWLELNSKYSYNQNKADVLKL